GRLRLRLGGRDTRARTRGRLRRGGRVGARDVVLDLERRGAGLIGLQRSQRVSVDGALGVEGDGSLERGLGSGVVTLHVGGGGGVEAARDAHVVEGTRARLRVQRG